MGGLEIALVVLMVLVVAGALVRLSDVRRTREKVAETEVTLASLKARLAAQAEQTEQWRAKAEEANALLAEKQETADLLASLPPESPAATSSPQSNSDGDSALTKPGQAGPSGDG